MEHELAPSALAAGVVDARDAGGVGERRRDQPVVADRRADDQHDAGAVELAEGADDVVLGAERQAACEARLELDRPVQATGGGDLVEPEPDGLFEAGAAVGLREVEQQPDEDGSGGYLHGGGVFWVHSARVNTVWACLFSRTSCKQSRSAFPSGSRS